MTMISKKYWVAVVGVGLLFFSTVGSLLASVHCSSEEEQEVRRSSLMKKIIYTRTDGGLSVVIPAPKSSIERMLGPLTDEEYELHVKTKSIPTDAINPRDVDDSDIPNNREFRNAWCDVTELSRIDIDCEKARDIKLVELRRKRITLLEEQDKLFMIAIEKEEDLTSIKAGKQRLRDITEPLKALDVYGKVNDETLLQQIRDLSCL